MFRGLLSVLMLTILMNPQPSHAQKADRGTEIARRVYSRDEGQDMITHAVMVLKAPNGSERRRKLMIYGREPTKAELSTLVRFLHPSEFKDTGLLTIGHPGKDADQWIYLPALKKSRLISSSRKGGSFVNSDFYYEDFQNRAVEKDRHRYLGKDTFEGVEALVIESIPVDPGNSAYTKRKIWVHPQMWLNLRVDFYEGNSDAPSKRLTAKKIQKVQGIWTVMEGEMESFKNKTKTLIAFEKVKYNSGLPQEFFSKATLEDPSREAKFK